MYDEHPVPTIASRTNRPDALLPKGGARLCLGATLLSLPLMIAALLGGVSGWAVLALGLGQSVVMAAAFTLLARLAATATPGAGLTLAGHFNERPYHG